VRGFIGAIETEADVATETFVMRPAGHDGPSRSQTPTGCPRAFGVDVRKVRGSPFGNAADVSMPGKRDSMIPSSA
jgi:hypothetical protein